MSRPVAVERPSGHVQSLWNPVGCLVEITVEAPMYSDIIMDHFVNPRHVGSVEEPDGYGEAGGGDLCPEDRAHVGIRVAGGRLMEVRHKTLGCPVAIAASSLTCELALGKTLAEAQQITTEAVTEALGEMPERKKGSVVAPNALQRAIAAHLQREAAVDRHV